MDDTSNPLSNPSNGQKEKQPNKIPRISLRASKIFIYSKIVLTTDEG